MSYCQFWGIEHEIFVNKQKNKVVNREGPQEAYDDEGDIKVDVDVP